MPFTIGGQAIDPHNGLATDGLTCDAFNEETWFPSSSPVANTAEPGSPDATDTSGPSGNSGMTGHFLITVPTSGSYWVATYNSWDPTVIAWVKVLTHPHTQLQGWTAAVDRTSNRNLATTNIAAGSNGAVLPQTSISVGSTAPNNPNNFSTGGGGLLLIGISGGWTAVRFSGVSGGNTFTGCAGGSGTLATGQQVIQGYQNGNYRRLVFLNADLEVQASGDQASLQPIATIGGAILQFQSVGIAQYHGGANALQEQFALSFPVDPLGYYGVSPGVTATGLVLATGNGRWIEVDF